MSNKIEAWCNGYRLAAILDITAESAPRGVISAVIFFIPADLEPPNKMLVLPNTMSGDTSQPKKSTQLLPQQAYQIRVHVFVFIRNFQTNDSFAFEV